MNSKTKKVLISATVLSHIAQFHRPLGELLHENGYVVHVAGNDNLALKNGLKLDWADKIFDIPFSRSPKSTSNIKAYNILKKLIDRENYVIIHCNTPMGGIVTRLAARKARKNGCKVFYTAHGFHFHKRASKLAWMTFYPIEKKFAKFTDKLITINHEDFAIASQKFHCQTFYTHGVGVDAKRYVPLSEQSEFVDICKELDLPANKKYILTVGELLPNKNQVMAIKAMRNVIREHPDVILLIAGNGPMEDTLHKFINMEGLSNNIKLIGYCTNLEKYQKIASLLIACSYREGLPLNLVEAMLAGNPIVASHNRGHDELISHGKNGFLVNPDDFESMSKFVIQLLDDNRIMDKMGIYARSFALNYSSDNVKEELKIIYEL